jgi:hypothetical protein
MLLQLSFRTPSIQSFRLLILGAKVDANTVHAMPLVLGVSKALALENMPEMSAAVVAHNLRPHHAHCAIGPLANSARHSVPEGGPAAARVEFVVCLVERCLAAAARVDAGIGVVLVEGTGPGRLGALLSENAELLWRVLVGMRGSRYNVCAPGESCVCHSPSVFCTG